MDPYFAFDAVSNSTLSFIKHYFAPALFSMDKEVQIKAYAFGTLVDAIITEPHKVDHYQRTVGKLSYTKEDFDKALRMRDAYMADSFCAQITPLCEFQKISIVEKFDIEHETIKFSLRAKCKWDLFINDIDFGGDIKSTFATTQKGFEEAVSFFDYDRQRAWYMDLEQRNNDMLIGISKANFKVFKVPITRDSELYLSGRRKYEELAFKYWYLYS